MLDFNKDIQELFMGVTVCPKISFFFATNENSDLQCIFSQVNKYKTGSHYNYYDLFPLIRILGTQNQNFSKNLLREIYKIEEEVLCFLLEWNEHVRKVIFIDLSEVANEEKESAGKALIQNKEKLKNVFQKYYYKSREED